MKSLHFFENHPTGTWQILTIFWSWSFKTWP